MGDSTRCRCHATMTHHFRKHSTLQAPDDGMSSQTHQAAISQNKLLADVEPLAVPVGICTAKKDSIKYWRDDEMLDRCGTWRALRGGQDKVLLPG